MEPAHHGALTAVSIPRKQRHANTQHQYERIEREELEMRGMRSGGRKERERGRSRREMSAERVKMRVI